MYSADGCAFLISQNSIFLQRTFVSSEKKDEKYWEKREKNNNASRRSYETRRLKENKIRDRAAYLENLENEYSCFKEALQKCHEKRDKTDAYATSSNGTNKEI